MGEQGIIVTGVFRSGRGRLPFPYFLFLRRVFS